MSPLLLAVIVAAVVLYLLYVSLVTKKNKVEEAASGIDVQLRKRYDLIPNLLNMAAKFMAHEKSLMSEITRLRTEAMATDFKASPAEKARLENELDSKLREFSISVENYPDLKSNQTMIEAMQSLNEVEEHLAASRRFYNAAVNDLKNAVEIFPGNLMAKALKITADMAYFDAGKEASKPINSNEYFK